MNFLQGFINSRIFLLYNFNSVSLELLKINKTRRSRLNFFWFFLQMTFLTIFIPKLLKAVKWFFYYSLVKYEYFWEKVSHPIQRNILVNISFFSKFFVWHLPRPNLRHINFEIEQLYSEFFCTFFFKLKVC